MVGSAIQRDLVKKGYRNIITRELDELDLIRQEDVERFFDKEKPDYVIDAAAKVGGILANNKYRAQFIYENIMIASNLIHASYQNRVKKFIFLGSSCIYPQLAPQPMKEEYLLTDTLEFTNEPYAIAKIAGIKLCENYYRQYGCNFFSVMPTNLFGPNDNFDLETSHVVAALIRKFHEAKSEQNRKRRSVTIWGTGKPYREFLYVADLADSIQFIIEFVNASDIYNQGITHVNIGTGKDITIKELAELIANVVHFKGDIIYDTSKPDGTPRKLLDVTRLHKLGWKHETSLRNGIEKVYKWYLEYHT